MKTYDIIIIGAGASGLFAAGRLCKKCKNICIIDMGNIPARKVAISGGGKCNFTNTHADYRHYFGKNPEFRETFDISVSRAVADLSVLSELCIPFVKKNCFFVAYKSSEIDEEILKARNAINKLSGSDADINKIKVPCSDIIRNMVIVEKKINTPKLYPRNPGVPSKKPL